MFRVVACYLMTFSVLILIGEPAFAKKPNLTVDFSKPIESEPHIFHFKITNNTKKTLEIRKRNTILEGLISPMAVDLIESETGKTVHYSGITYEPLQGFPEPILILTPNASYEGKIDLTDAFILNKGTLYKLKQPDRILDKDGRKITIRVSGEMSFVSSRSSSHPSTKSNLENLGLSGPNQPSMPTCQMIDNSSNTPYGDQNLDVKILKVHDYLIHIVSDAYENFFEGDCFDEAYFERWFGENNPVKYTYIKEHIKTLYDLFNQGKYQIVCADDPSGWGETRDSLCNQGAGAWTWLGYGSVNNNPSFYCFKYKTPEGDVYRNSLNYYPAVENLSYISDIEQRADNGRPVVRSNLPYVILHENGHAMADLIDRTYDPTVALQWAKDDDQRIIDNNNSHIFFLLEKYINGNQGFCH